MNYRPAQRDFLFMTMYYIANVLPEVLNEKILPYKQMMFDQYHCKVGLKSPAHITFIPPYYMDETFENELITDLDNVCSSLQPVTVRTNNFSSFKPKTIFIDVAVDEKLQSLKKSVDAYFQTRTQYKMKLDTRPFHPHITIATRDMHKKIFYEVFPYFQQKNFLEQWEVNGLSLLRHNQKNWDVIHTSQFQKL